jgi:hypothetical protein
MSKCPRELPLSWPTSIYKPPQKIEALQTWRGTLRTDRTRRSIWPDALPCVRSSCAIHVSPTFNIERPISMVTCHVPRVKSDRTRRCNVPDTRPAFDRSRTRACEAWQDAPLARRTEHYRSCVRSFPVRVQRAKLVTRHVRWRAIGRTSVSGQHFKFHCSRALLTSLRLDADALHPVARTTSPMAWTDQTRP